MYACPPCIKGNIILAIVYGASLCKQKKTVTSSKKKRSNYLVFKTHLKKTSGISIEIIV
jgi:hypothetical protein